jgi:hypothetical protein
MTILLQYLQKVTPVKSCKWQYFCKANLLQHNWQTIPQTIPIIMNDKMTKVLRSETCKWLLLIILHNYRRYFWWWHNKTRISSLRKMYSYILVDSKFRGGESCLLIPLIFIWIGWILWQYWHYQHLHPFSWFLRASDGCVLHMHKR